jgi:tRNA-specific 2-thiouridylase
MQDVSGKKIFVGLSGGVDSAVSAALLKDAGAQVTGVFIKGWYPPGMPCTWAADRRDAMRVAARLRIPFVTLDASAEYKKGVIEYLLSEYALGRTPNPDIMCNREVKFGAFYRYAKEQGADFIATGHYARTREGKLLRGIDDAKDQSYFLWAIPAGALAMTLFPVGELPKTVVRDLAQKHDLPVAEKKDSQGICFLGNISVDDFLRAEIQPEQGIVRTESGEDIGTHDGAVLYTLGARIAIPEASPGPWYVLRKDMQQNILTVSLHRNQGDNSRPIALRDTNWLATLDEARTIEAQYRYHGPRISGTYDSVTNRFVPDVPLAEPVAPGQSLVLYSGEQCLGGGIIS